MPSRPQPNQGNLPPMSPELVEQLSAFRDQGQMIDSGQESVRRGYEILNDVGCRGQLKPLTLPEPLRFVVVPVAGDLYVETRQRRWLKRKVWGPAEPLEALKPDVLWPRSYTTNPWPVFIGSIEVIDYDSPNQEHWIYNKRETARAAICKGTNYILRTTTQIYKTYGLS